MSSERVFEVGEEITVRRWGSLTRAKIVRRGVALRDHWHPDVAAYVLWIRKSERWTMHPQPLSAYEADAFLERARTESEAPSEQ